ncbi:hypothetical protein [Marinigracilibium pacificum]|uniref:STAS/SEC14 domain-containing protein n=1 Tax=Marinigracilibium pacificum TaxID=2729599 RepID=A0A848J3C7_9BACT|nr:hypothetical protein [Marinigracilibium pacificum]NMM48994.1 hypothetical protein [Marinigracilibium pacificum]
MSSTFKTAKNHKVLLERKNLIVTHNVEENYVYLRWVGFQKEEGIIESGEEVLKIFQKLDCKNILNDNREVKGPWNTAAEWTLNNWFPRMIQAGLTKFAWVFPENIFAELSAAKAMPDNELVKKFNSYIEAEQWLAE